MNKLINSVHRLQAYSTFARMSYPLLREYLTNILFPPINWATICFVTVNIVLQVLVFMVPISGKCGGDTYYTYPKSHLPTVQYPVIVYVTVLMTWRH